VKRWAKSKGVVPLSPEAMPPFCFPIASGHDQRPRFPQIAAGQIALTVKRLARVRVRVSAAAVTADATTDASADATTGAVQDGGAPAEGCSLDKDGLLPASVAYPGRGPYPGLGEEEEEGGVGDVHVHVPGVSMSCSDKILCWTRLGLQVRIL
jgi:hypothetical protein